MLAFGNASAVDREAGVMAIKPSGADYEALRPEDIVVIRLDDGQIVAGDRRPSSDTPTHLALYRAFASVGAVIHTHSRFASAWAQARREIPCLGTTHADHFDGPVPVTRPMTAKEIAGAYEANTGAVIVERFAEGGLDPARVPAALVAHHGPFVWSGSIGGALEVALAVEEVAAMAFHTALLEPAIGPIAQSLLGRHFDRKHGPAAYYGQPSPVAGDRSQAAQAVAPITHE